MNTLQEMTAWEQEHKDQIVKWITVFEKGYKSVTFILDDGSETTFYIKPKHENSSNR